MSTTSSVTDLAHKWVALDTDESTQGYIRELLDRGATAELEELLCHRLEFGTAGLRGKMGPGFNRMNHVTIQQTTQGLCRYIQDLQVPEIENGVAIGFDGRHHSRQFAHIAASVFTSRGIRVHLFSSVVPTPWVAAATRLLSCAAGIMVTASHNPKDYNGYKVYWSNGCQIIPPHDHGIADQILQNLDLWPISDPTGAHHLISDPSKAVTEWYYQQLALNLHFRNPLLNARTPRVVYTPLHGVGAHPVRRAFQVFKLPEPFVVPQQEVPDPDFPTVVFPNPEEGAGTWSLAFTTASRLNTQLVLANDPDADRLAVAELLPGGGYRPFSGNEIGLLLAHWVWTNTRLRNPQEPASSYAMLASTVSSRALRAMAQKEGFEFRETLTGFKWLGNVSLELERGGKTVLFAFEEAIGFMFGQVIKDKDGVAAAAVFAEMAAALYNSGTTVQRHLQDLYRHYGQYAYRSGYFLSDSPGKTRAIFERLRSPRGQLKDIGGVRVMGVRDLGTGVDTTQPDGKPVLYWTPGDTMITWYLERDGVITLRASGTEPKVKWYLEVVGEDPEEAARKAQGLVEAVADEVVQVEASGLRWPVVE